MDHKEIIEIYKYLKKEFEEGDRVIVTLVWLLLACTLIPLSLAKGKDWWFAVPLLIGGLVSALVVYYRIRSDSLRNVAPLKGAKVFGLDEGRFLRGLVNKEEFFDLRTAVRSGDYALIVVYGREGVGKTSLVNARLRDELNKTHCFYYVDARQNDIGEIVSRELGAECDEGAATLRKVIVVDNVNLMGNLAGLQDLIVSAMKVKPLYRKVLIIITDEGDFGENWEGKRWYRPTAVKAREIKAFSIEHAKVVAGAIGDRAQKRLPGSVVDEVVEDLVAGSTVSPLMLSVVLREVSESRRRVRLEDYRGGGDAIGFIIRYIRRHLKVESEEDRDKILQALARQAGSARQVFRAGDLEVSGIGLAELTDALRGLSNEEVRILGATRRRDEFWINEDWLPAIRASGENLSPSHASLVNRIKRKCEWWEEEKQSFRGMRWAKVVSRGRYLLAKADLAQFGFLATDRFTAKELEYISLSRRHLRLRRQVAAGLLLALLVASVPLYWAGQRIIFKIEAGAWGLPDDIHSFGDQIKQLSVVCMVDHLRWVPEGLESLDANCERITSLDGIPPSLTHLGVSRTRISSLDGLPAGIQDLNIGNSAITSVEALRGRSLNNLASLDITGVHVGDMKAIPRRLARLTLRHPSIRRLEGLPESLVYLNIGGTSVVSLKGLPDNLTHLVLDQPGDDIPSSPLFTIDYLPGKLVSLETKAAIPKALLNGSPALEHLVLAEIASYIPASVTHLELKNSTIKGDPPAGLVGLKFHDRSSFERWSERWGGIPESVRHLKTVLSEGEGLDALPTNLISLDVSGSPITSVVGLANSAGVMKDLNISETGVLDLEGVPDIEVLRFEFCRSSRLDMFPKGLLKLFLGGCSDLESIDNLPATLTELHLGKTRVREVRELSELKNLKLLDISNTEIRGQLPALPASLTHLILDVGQIRTLGDLPASVTKLVFVPHEPKPNGV